MSKLDEFLSTSISDPKLFKVALASAARELVAKKNRCSPDDVLFDGDANAVNAVNAGSIYPVISSSNSKDLLPHLRSSLKQWQSKGSVSFFRGTRLPDPAGSFSSDVSHASPDVHTAIAYGIGDANSSTGIGRLIPSIGFLNVHQIETSAATFRNFEYEDTLGKTVNPSRNTVKGLVESLKELVSESEVDMSVFTRENDNYSPGEIKLGSLTGKYGHYETMVNQNGPRELMMISGKHLYSVDLKDQDWQKLLCRVQEASLRDFYEINPLDRALNRLAQAKEGIPVSNERDHLFVSSLTEFIHKERSTRINAPFEGKELTDVALSGSPYVDARPYIKESKRVGSSTSADTRYPANINKIIMAVSAVESKDIAAARSLFTETQATRNKSNELAEELTPALRSAARLISNLTAQKPSSKHLKPC